MASRAKRRRRAGAAASSPRNDGRVHPTTDFVGVICFAIFGIDASQLPRVERSGGRSRLVARRPRVMRQVEEQPGIEL